MGQDPPLGEGGWPGAERGKGRSRRPWGLLGRGGAGRGSVPVPVPVPPPPSLGPGPPVRRRALPVLLRDPPASRRGAAGPGASGAGFGGEELGGIAPRPGTPSRFAGGTGSPRGGRSFWVRGCRGGLPPCGGAALQNAGTSRACPELCGPCSSRRRRRRLSGLVFRLSPRVGAVLSLLGAQPGRGAGGVPVPGTRWLRGPGLSVALLPWALGNGVGASAARVFPAGGLCPGSGFRLGLGNVPGPCGAGSSRSEAAPKR